MTVLERILAAHRAAAASDRRPVEDLVERALDAPVPVRDFRGAVAGPGVSVIAEIKRRSPSKGLIAPDLVAGVVAKAYEEGGAAALSVLTDVEFFGGSPADLDEARSSCRLPVLRKDFTVDERDLCDARIMGADAVLLIVSALSQQELARFVQLAATLKLTALVEVHDEAELDRAVEAGAGVIGVNQRNLRTFDVDRQLAELLSERFPPGVVRIAESGIHHRQQVHALAEAGYHAVLVGESLVTAHDPASAVRALTGGLSP